MACTPGSIFDRLCGRVVREKDLKPQTDSDEQTAVDSADDHGSPSIVPFEIPDQHRRSA